MWLHYVRTLAEYCEYGDSLNIMLHDRLVCGVNHEGIQRRLLSEKDLTYEKALEIALAMEVAAKDTKDLLAASNAPTGLHYTATGGGSFKNRSVRATRQPHNPQSKSKATKARANPICYRCGGPHLAPQCKFCNAECRRCKKIGHIAKVFRSKSTAPRPTHYMQNSEISQTEDPFYDLFMTQEVDKTRDPIVITLELNGVPLDMELDTGASLTLLNKSTYKAITHDASTGLQPSDAQLRTYTGQLVETLGTTTVQAKYDEQLLQLPVHVVDGGGPNLLGRDWLGKFKINVTNVCTLMAPDKLNQVLNTHSQVFEEGLGTLNNVKVNLAIDPSVPPKFHKARSFPFALKEKVELKLQRLEELGIISPVTHSEWAAPIVPVMKQNSDVRTCGDYHVTVNQAIQIDSYPLPKIEELFAKLTGGEYFSKLDMSQAYFQLQLVDNSKKLVTVKTHRGLFQYNRLPFGISAAPAVFQRTMETCCEDAKGYVSTLMIF